MPIEEQEEEPFGSKGSEGKNQEFELPGVLSETFDEKAGDAVKVYEALKKIYRNGINAYDDKYEGPFPITSDIDYPIEHGEQQKRPAGGVEDVRACPDDLDDWE